MVQGPSSRNEIFPRSVGLAAQILQALAADCVVSATGSDYSLSNQRTNGFIAADIYHHLSEEEVASHRSGLVCGSAGCWSIAFAYLTRRA